MSKKVWMPKEFKSKEIILFHLPIIKRPVTKRQALYAALGVPLSIAILVAAVKFIKPNDIETWIPIWMFVLAMPIYFATLSSKEAQGRYIEDIIKTKINHKKQSGIILNEKALRAVQRGREKSWQ